MKPSKTSEPTKSLNAAVGRRWVILLFFAVVLQVSWWRSAGIFFEDFSSNDGSQLVPAATSKTDTMKRGDSPQLRIRLNSADQVELEVLPRVGPELAARIVEFRDANYPVTSVERLLEVPGIGPARLAEISSYLDLDFVDLDDALR